jgi:Bacterial Ig-like domain (group 3)
MIRHPGVRQPKLTPLFRSARALTPFRGLVLMKTRCRMLVHVLLVALLAVCWQGQAHAHRTQKDLPTSENGSCPSPNTTCDGVAYLLWPYTPLILTTSATSSVTAQVSVTKLGSYSGTYPCTFSSLCDISESQTLVAIQLLDSSGNPLAQGSGFHLVGIAIKAVGQNTEATGPGYFVPQSFDPFSSIVTSTGLATETNDSDCIDDSDCEVFASTTITSVDNSTISYWPIGNNRVNSSVGVTATTLAIPGFPDLSNPPSGSNFDPSTIVNNLNPASASSFAILVYDASLNNGAGEVVTLGSLALSQPTNSRSLTSTFDLSQQSLPYREVVNAIGGVTPNPPATVNLGIVPTPTPPSCQTDGSFSGVLNRVVEYSYTPPSTQDVAIDTSGSRYDTVIVVSTTEGAPVACNDDYTDPGTGYIYSQAQIPSLTLNAGTTYLIQVGEYPDSVLYPTEDATNLCSNGTSDPGQCPAINKNPILHFGFSIPAPTATTTSASSAVAFCTPNPQAVALSAKVINTSATVDGGTVTFTVLNGSTPIGSPVTSATVTNGAASVSYALPGSPNAGSYTIQAVYSGVSDSFLTSSDSSQTLTIGQSTPPILWETPASIQYGTPLGSLQLHAHSPVTGTMVFTPPAGTVLPLGSNTLSATFTPAKTADYTTATATVTIFVEVATPVITWATPAPIPYGTKVGPTQQDATANVPGTFVYSQPAGWVPIVGTHTMTVTFTPTDTTDYRTASATVTLTVIQATPAITWATPAAIAYGKALSGVQLDATAKVAGTFVYSPVAGTVLPAGAQTLNVTFTPTNTTDYTTATGSVALTVTRATPIVTWPTPAPITYGTAVGPTQQDATANVPGTFSYYPMAGWKPIVGTHTMTVTFTPTDSTDYKTVTATVTLTVNPAT